MNLEKKKSEMMVEEVVGAFGKVKDRKVEKQKFSILIFFSVWWVPKKKPVTHVTSAALQLLLLLLLISIVCISFLI